MKLEVDTSPPGDAETSIKYHLHPVPFYISLMNPPYLFAGKVHALLCREWKGGRIKGRDLYDYVWFISQKTPLHLRCLSERMKQSGHLNAGLELDRSAAMDLLVNKFKVIDYSKAKSDIFPFIKDPGRIVAFIVPKAKTGFAAQFKFFKSRLLAFSLHEVNVFD